MVTTQQRAIARTHVERLNRQRQNPEDILRKLEREGSDEVAQIREYINYQEEQNQSLVTTVSEEIYTSAGRVVFEMIQNADDASFPPLANPFITFELHHDRIIIESNESGFTPSNVEAICKVGSSDKGENATGEKGLGFKSVFMIASKVHIESAGYSFSFCFKKGDRESKKSTPQYENLLGSPDDDLTRITLFLLEDEAKRREALNSFEKIPPTLLLFLRKVKKLTINNWRTLISPRSTTYTCQRRSIDQENLYRETLTTNINNADCKDTPSTKHFQIIRHLARGLTTNEKRKNQDSEIKLAFQVTSENVPLMEKQQDIFAHLPIGTAGIGFNFLIQADFATTANREALITTSERNIELREQIAKLFVEAVLQFCHIPELKFKWLLYLPGDSISDEFWGSLGPRIEKHLQETRFLLSNRESLHHMHSLRFISKEYEDTDGNPIFSDLPVEKYVNHRYGTGMEKLKTLGLMEMDVLDLVERVKGDVQPENSRMKSPSTDGKWHTLAAKALTLLLLKSRSRIMDLELVPIIPMWDPVQKKPRQWTSAATGNVYFPKKDDVSIPTDIGLKLVFPNAIEDSARKQLFIALNIDDAPSKLVRKAVFDKYPLAAPSSGSHLKASVTHLRYLWWTHAERTENDKQRLADMSVYNQEERLCLLNSEENNIFFDTDDQYGAGMIFSDKSLLLHHDYLEASSSKDKVDHPAWKDWLSDFLGVQRYIPLVARRNSSELSPIFKMVAGDQPEKVVGLLGANWGKYQKAANGHIRKKIANIEVLVETQDGQESKSLLRSTYLPDPALQKICKSFSADHIFPFLKLPLPISERDLFNWNFLSAFDVKYKEGLDFYLELFERIEYDAPNSDQVFKIYDRIYLHSMQEERQEETLKFFSEKQRIFYPLYNTNDFTWTDLDQCLWDAPPYMRSKVPLLTRYNQISNSASPRFFQEILKIRNLRWEDLIRELEMLRDSGPEISFEDVKDIYVQLNTMRVQKPDLCNTIRKRFEESKLVWLHRQNAWKAPSSCLWSSKVEIASKGIVSKQFDKDKQKGILKTFFLECLCVSEPSLDLFVEELKRLANPLLGKSVSREDNDSFMKVKTLIKAINSMPLGEAGSLGIKIRSESILPVRLKNTRMLKSSADYFSITDRQKHAEAFGNKASLLDFSLEEVLELEPFIRWLGLEERYLSRRVTESSTFGGSDEICSLNLTQELRLRAKTLLR